MQRRDFLLGGCAASLATSLVAASAGAAEPAGQAPLEIVDTHTHFYDPTRPQGVPWPAKSNQDLYRPVLPPEFRKLAEPHSVTGTVVVEASPWVEDNQWLLDLAEREPFVVGIVGRLDPASDEFEQHLRRFAAHRLYRGIRISQGDLRKLATKDLAARCKLLVDLDLELDVNGGPDMPAEAARLAEQIPELRIVLNHCANVTIDGRTPPSSWQAGMTQAARHPRVFCKVSALPAADSLDRYRPVLDVLWTVFGEDRLLFGSNWPVSNRGQQFGQVLQRTLAYFREKGPAALRKFTQENARLAYAWQPR